MSLPFAIAAYIWPAYTGDEPRTRIFWPDGYGEWQTVRAATAKFPGHQWPRRPLWGYVNEADPRVMEMQIDAAADRGVNVFIYDWYFPHISVGWDTNPRFKDLRHGIVKNNTPEAIERALRRAKAFIESRPINPPLITINSWNEWTETSYLQPDDLYGYGYLQAIRRVFGAK